MAIPEQPLELDIEVGSLTLQEAAIFDAEEAQAAPMTWCNRVRKFLLAHSQTWTPDEINTLTLDEIGDVAESMAEAIQRATVPLANSAPSRTGHGASRRPSRGGRSTTNTQPSSAGTRKTSPAS